MPVLSVFFLFRFIKPRLNQGPKNVVSPDGAAFSAQAPRIYIDSHGGVYMRADLQGKSPCK